MFKFFSNLSKKKEKIEQSLLKPQRFNDGILIITQDNIAKSLKIEAANANAIDILGYKKEEILDHDFREFVTDFMNDEINSNFEFEETGKSLSEVLNKIRRFKMKTKSGAIIPLRLRVVRSLSTYKQPRFQLVMNNDSLHNSLQNEREKYRLNMGIDDIFETNTKLLSRASIIKELEIISSIAAERSILGTIAFIEINNYDLIKESFEETVLNSLMRQISQKIQFAGREEDIIGMYDERSFVIILLETPFENVSIPLKRLKHIIGEQDYEFDFKGIKNTLQIPVNISYRKILANINPEKFLEDIKSGNGVVFE